MRNIPDKLLETADGEGILEICKNDISIIEDVTHAFSTKLNNKYIGLFDDVTCLNFYTNKAITTGKGRIAY